jgi:lipopolysaccharide transport protein LptA
MKKIILILTAGWCGLAAAQTNTPVVTPASTNTSALTATNAPMDIYSDTAEFDMDAHLAVYRGNVRVNRPDTKMTCGWMQVDLPDGGGHLSHIVATTNVVIDFTDAKGQKYHVTSAKAVYDYKVENAVTNEIVTFTGNPVVKTSTSTIESEPMVWDRIRNKFFFNNPKMHTIGDLGNDTNGTPKLF